MKFIIFFILTIPFFLSCKQLNNKKEIDNFKYLPKESYANYKYKSQANNNNYQKLKNYKIIDPQFGISYGTIQIPVSWKESNKNDLLFEGSNKLMVYKEISNHSNLNTPIKNIKTFINKDIKSLANSEGFYFIKQYPLPQMAQLDTRLNSYMFKAVPEQRQYQCIVTEWENKKGISSVIIIRYYTTQYQTGSYRWGFTLNVLEAENNYFKKIKNIYINSLLNFQINPKWIETSNQYWSQVAQQSNIEHRKRIEAIETFGNNNTILYNERNRISDKNHNKFIDNIRDETNITDPNGNTYKVESGYNYYWINNNGEYLKSNNPNYNPNTDPAYNNQRWRQTKIKN